MFFFPPVEELLVSLEIEMLEEKHLAEKDVEIRIWILPPFSSLVSGYIFTRVGAQWSGVFVDGETPEQKGTRAYRPGVSWNQVLSELTDCSELPKNKVADGDVQNVIIDGFWFFIEIKAGGQYRAYHYPVIHDPEMYFDDPYAIDCVYKSNQIYRFFQRR